MLGGAALVFKPSPPWLKTMRCAVVIVMVFLVSLSTVWAEIYQWRNLEELKKLKVKVESRGGGNDLKRVTNAVDFFERQLGDLERRASLAGVPRNWRE